MQRNHFSTGLRSEYQKMLAIKDIFSVQVRRVKMTIRITYLK